MRDKNGRELTNNETMNKVVKRIDTILLEAELMWLRWIGHFPSHLVRRFFYRVSGISIGKGTSIHMWASFYNPRHISIGNDSIVGERIVLDGREKITIGNHVDIASEVMIYNGEHDVNDEKFKPTFSAVTIEDYAFIGPRAIILPGVTIKKGAVVGAGAVVTKDIEEYAVVGGVPARVIGERQIKDPSYRLGRAALFR